MWEEAHPGDDFIVFEQKSVLSSLYFKMYCQYQHVQIDYIIIHYKMYVILFVSSLG